MKPSVLLALILSASGLGACETATPYQPLGAAASRAAGGYFDHQIDSDRWQVGFKGNDVTGRETVERYLLYRAAELTVGQGCDWFVAVGRRTDVKVQGFVDPYWGPRWGLYRRGYGARYGYWGDPFWGPGGVAVSQTDRFQATAEIVIGHGPKPNDRQAFDARSVIQHLGPTIRAPRA